MLIHSRLIRAPLAILASAICVTASSLTAQESTTSFDGPPKEVDENAVPAGIGFNQPGGELSATALEQAAIGNPTVHYHYYGAPVSQTAPAPTSTPAPAPAPETTTPPGYAPNTYVAPIATMPTTSWHLYTGNIGGAVGGNFGNALGGRVGGSTNFYIPNNGMSGYSPSPDNIAYGSGAFVGDWDPYANGGTGSIQGFD